MGSAVATLMLVALTTILTTSAQFICNNYKKQAACDGATASDGICQWGLFGCSSARPLPSPTIAQRQPPKIVCPSFVAEVACIYDPCGLGQLCFANAAAVCVPNTCQGAFEYLGTKLSVPCAAVWVDLETMEVVDCNVKEIVREVDEDAVRPEEGEEQEGQLSQLQQALQTSSSTSTTTPQVSGMLVGLPPLTSPSIVEEDTLEVNPVTAEEEEEEELIPEPEPEPEQIIFFPQPILGTDETDTEADIEANAETDAEAEALARAIAEADGEELPTLVDEGEEEEEEEESEELSTLVDEEDEEEIDEALARAIAEADGEVFPTLVDEEEEAEELPTLVDQEDEEEVDEELARAIAEADGLELPALVGEEEEEDEEEEEEEQEEPIPITPVPSVILSVPQLILPSLSLTPIEVEQDEPIAVDDSEMPIAKQALGEEEEAFFKNDDVTDEPTEEGRA